MFVSQWKIRSAFNVGLLLFFIGAGALYAYVTDQGVYTPPDYLSYMPPAAGGSYSDAVFGTAIKRLTDSMRMIDAAAGGTLATVITEFSTMSPFNKDNTRLLLLHLSYFALYDGSGNFLNNLPFEINASSEPRWSRSDPFVLYYRLNNQLKQFNVGSNTMSVVRTFNEYSTISGAGESDICFDGNHFVFVGDGRDVFVYEISSNTKGSLLDTGGVSFDGIYITPNDNIVISWNIIGTNRFTGIELFDRNMNFLRQVTRVGGHMDVTRDVNGDEVLVWSNAADPNPICPNGLVKVRLQDSTQTCLLTLDWSLTAHISATDDTGWVLAGTYNPFDPAPPSDWFTYTNELIQITLDGRQVRRLAHHRSRPFNDYVYTPRMSVSRDGSRVAYSSNFGLQQILGNPIQYSDAYLIDMTVASPPGGDTTLNVNPTSSSPGGTMTVAWDEIASPTGTDWIGLFRVGTANSAFIDWNYVSCSKAPGSPMVSGSCGFVLPGNLADGTYQFRLFLNNGFTLLATSNDFTVSTGGGGTPTLSASPTAPSAGQTVTATWGGIASPSGTDWVGLFRVGTANSAYIDWNYVNCSKAPGSPMVSGSCGFVLPGNLADGTYQFRLFLNNGFTLPATSNVFTVTTGGCGGGSGPNVCVSPALISSGGTITVSWNGIPAPSPSDWLGLYQPGAGNTSYIGWMYVSCSTIQTTPRASGSCTFVLNQPPGSYEFRLLGNNGFADLARSSIFTVTVP